MNVHVMMVSSQSQKDGQPVREKNMKIANLHKAFSVTYQVAIIPDDVIKVTLGSIKETINMHIANTEYWIDSIEPCAYPEGLALLFTFRIAYVIPLGSKQERLETLDRVAQEIEKTLLVELEMMKEAIC